MYKYQCSKPECGTTWTLNEGKLNGFVLTCPICGKGRGLFVSQTKREFSETNKDGIETMVISVGAASVKSALEIEELVSAFVKKHTLTEIGKDVQSNGHEYVCTLHYKINHG